MQRPQKWRQENEHLVFVQLRTEASTKKNEPVRARANFLAWLGIDSFLLTISSTAITARLLKKVL